MCVYICVCVYIYIYVCVYIYIYVCVYRYVCVCVYIYIYIYVCDCVYIYVCIYICVCIYIYVNNEYRLCTLRVTMKQQECERKWSWYAPEYSWKRCGNSTLSAHCGRAANRLHDREPVSRWTSAHGTLMAYCREESYERAELSPHCNNCLEKPKNWREISVTLMDSTWRGMHIGSAST